MGVERKYIMESGYEIAEEFAESMQEIDIRTGIKIAEFIDNNVDSIDHSKLISTVLGGLIVDDYNEVVTFALEIIKEDDPIIIISDITMVSMDEYLDLINLNLKKR